MMLNDYFAPTLYQALLAEVNWNLEMEYVSKNLLFILIRLLGKNEKNNIQDGLIISVWGFSDSIPKLLVKIAELISNYEPSESGFNAMRELLVQPMVIFFYKFHNILVE